MFHSSPQPSCDPTLTTLLINVNIIQDTNILVANGFKLIEIQKKEKEKTTEIYLRGILKVIKIRLMNICCE